ncbi:MAG: type II toxin-antitoxin system PemK/MazF family toxin [Patescibacteria group bacterium]
MKSFKLRIAITKDFVAWHTLKSRIEAEHTPRLFREREIWWCSLGANVGVEEDGKHTRFERPVLVLRKFNKEMFWALPLTSKEKYGAYYQSVDLHGEKRTVMLSQLRVLSTKRLIRRLGKMSERSFGLIEQSVIDLIKQTDLFRGPRVPNGNL